jgi:hypothetical protein
MFTHSISAKPQQRPKPPTFVVIDELVKNCRRSIAGDLNAFFQFFCFDFLHIDLSNNFLFLQAFLPKFSKVKEKAVS